MQKRFYNLGNSSWLAWANDRLPQRPMQPSIAGVSEQLDQRFAASRHTTAPISRTRYWKLIRIHLAEVKRRVRDWAGLTIPSKMCPHTPLRTNQTTLIIHKVVQWQVWDVVYDESVLITLLQMSARFVNKICQYRPTISLTCYRKLADGKSISAK